MTAEEKTAIARFLTLAADYLRDGHRREHETPEFSAEHCSAVDEQDPAAADFSSLPLAYQVDEEDESGYPEESHSSFLPPHSSFSPLPTDSLEAVAVDIGACKACGLAPTRTLAVPGEGVENPLVMVIGEGPGADEDRAGRPFVGRSGQLLDKMLGSIGLSRGKNCFIVNMVKCRPPGNREPSPEEIAVCFPYLKRQLALLRPRIILCAGSVAAQNLLKTSKGIKALRGTFTEFILEETSIPVLCTFHPGALLRDESLKRPVWEDLKLLKARLDSLDRE